MPPLLRNSVSTITIVLSAAVVSPGLYKILSRPQPSSVPEWVGYGVMYSITSAWAIWAALSVRPFVERVAALALCLLILEAPWVMGHPSQSWSQELRESFFAVGGMPAMISWAVLRFFGWRADRMRAATGAEALDQQSWQFTIRSLLAATTVVACVMPWRRLFVADPNSWLQLDFTPVYDFFAGLGLLAAVVAWLVLGTRLILIRLCVTCGLCASLVAWMWYAGFEDLGFASVTLAVLLAVLLLPFRMLGYRLVRLPVVREASPQPAGGEGSL